MQKSLYLALLSMITLQISLDAMEKYALPGMVIDNEEIIFEKQSECEFSEGLASDKSVTLLHVAASGGVSDRVIELINSGVDVNSVDGHGCTALHYAAQNGHEGCVGALILHGKADVNIANKFGDTALYMATLNGHESCVRIILQAADVKVEAIGSFGDIALQCAIVKKHRGCAQLLVDYYTSHRITIPKKLKSELRGLGINIKGTACLLL